MKKCKTALIGIHGFGRKHLKQLLLMQTREDLELIAVSDLRMPSEDLLFFKDQGINCYTDYKKMLLDEREIDFVVLSTPIHLHAAMAIDVMESGYHILLEKPPASVIQELDKIIETAEKTGRECAVNFLNASGKAFKELQRVLSAAVLGEIKTITGIGLWQRDENYYARTSWSGKVKEGEKYILDGTIHNSLSHLLNNMLIIAGIVNKDDEQAIVPILARGELYHANAIDSEDTSCIQVKMSNGVELYYYATQCSLEPQTPCIRIDGSEGSAIWDYNNSLIIEKNGDREIYEFGEENYLENMYMNLIKVISGESDKLICPVKATRNFMLVSNGSFESSGRIHAIPVGFCHKVTAEQDNSYVTTIPNIEEIFHSAAEKKLLFSDMGVPWSHTTMPFNLSDYNRFPVRFV